jgi:aspartate racemase
MKSIGIAAVTAEGAADCYKHIVNFAAQKLGENKHPEIILINHTFDEILKAQQRRDWTAVANILLDSSQKAKRAGADFIVIPANSVHFAYSAIASQAPLPVINLVEEVALECKRNGYNKVAVLGVGLTMADGLYDQPLHDRSIESIPLTNTQRQLLDKIIYAELVHGIVKPHSQASVLDICNRLKEAGAQALVLACTELPLIINYENTLIPVVDSTRLLAKVALDWALDS